MSAPLITPSRAAGAHSPDFRAHVLRLAQTFSSRTFTFNNQRHRITSHPVRGYNHGPRVYRTHRYTPIRRFRSHALRQGRADPEYARLAGRGAARIDLLQVATLYTAIEKGGRAAPLFLFLQPSYRRLPSARLPATLHAQADRSPTQLLLLGESAFRGLPLHESVRQGLGTDVLAKVLDGTAQQA